MTRYLLDADTVIDLLARRPAAVELLSRLDALRDELCVCDVVLAELYSGLSDRERTEAVEFVPGLRFLPTYAEAGIQAGAWRYLYARQGRQLATTDCRIAATAHAHGATLITGNVRDFPQPEISLLQLPK